MCHLPVLPNISGQNIQRKYPSISLKCLATLEKIYLGSFFLPETVLKAIKRHFGKGMIVDVEREDQLCLQDGHSLQTRMSCLSPVVVEQHPQYSEGKVIQVAKYNISY